MRAMIVILLFLLSACSMNSEQSTVSRVRAFYSSYLLTLGSKDNKYPQSQIREYISADTILRYEEISSIPDQDLLGSDSFAYVQDYDPAWVPALTVGTAKPFLGGEVMPVWIGGENDSKTELEVFVRRESGTWKIYRVRDVTNNYEHPIFDAGALTQAKSAAISGF